MIDLPNPFIDSEAASPALGSAVAQPDAPCAAVVIIDEPSMTMEVEEEAPAVSPPNDDAAGATDHIHEIFFHASRLIADDYRDWALTQEDDDLYEALKAADQANTRDLAAPPDYYALLEATELLPLFLRRA